MAAMIEDVARQSEIDPKIAERILRAGLADVDPEVIRKVLESASAMDFSLPKTRTIGILYAEESGKGLTHPFFNPMLNAVKDEAEAHGYDITFINYRSIKDGESIPDHCRVHSLDGVCMVCINFTEPEIRVLVDSGIPCVTVDHFFRGIPAVISDNETGVQKLVEYAISRGHKRIAFVHGHNNSIVTRMRIQQFKNTMLYHEFSVPPEYVREGEYDNIEMTRKIVEELLELPERPTCILLPDDTAYLGAQDAARAMGLHIPGDISFAGYDGISLSQQLEPKLTTIRQDCERLGRTAAELLISLIESPETAKRKPIIFPVTFIEGGTIGKCPG